MRDGPFAFAHPSGICIGPGLTEDALRSHVKENPGCGPEDMHTGWMWYTMAPVRDGDVGFRLGFEDGVLKMVEVFAMEKAGGEWSSDTEERRARDTARDTARWLERRGFCPGTFAWGSVWCGVDAKALCGKAVITYAAAARAARPAKGGAPAPAGAQETGRTGNRPQSAKPGEAAPAADTTDTGDPRAQSGLRITLAATRETYPSAEAVELASTFENTGTADIALTFWWNRTLSTYCDGFLGAGFAVERIVEPTVTRRQLRAYPELDDELRVPNFIVFALRKPLLRDSGHAREARPRRRVTSRPDSPARSVM